MCAAGSLISDMRGKALELQSPLSLKRTKSLASLRLGRSNLQTRPLASNSANSPYGMLPAPRLVTQRFCNAAQGRSAVSIHRNNKWSLFMEYQVSARKWRPQRFDDIIG